MKTDRMPGMMENERRRIEIFGNLTGEDKMHIGMQITALVREALLKNLRVRFKGDETLVQQEFRRIWLGEELAAEIETHLAGRASGA